jgi:hypothetical protein
MVMQELTPQEKRIKDFIRPMLKEIEDFLTDEIARLEIIDNKLVVIDMFTDEVLYEFTP